MDHKDMEAFNIVENGFDEYQTISCDGLVLKQIRRGVATHIGMGLVDAPAEPKGEIIVEVNNIPDGVEICSVSIIGGLVAFGHPATQDEPNSPMWDSAFGKLLCDVRPGDVENGSFKFAILLYLRDSSTDNDWHARIRYEVLCFGK
jgi:hypothetical protein